MVPSEARNSGVRLTDLSKSYGDVKAVRGVNISIRPGETLALLGPNGAGKSTTIDMVLGLTRPDSGTVTLFGSSPADAVQAGGGGGMLQTGSLPGDLSVRELVVMVASLYPHPLDVSEVLRLTGTTEFADRPTTKLSGGQTQRVRMAIALVADPDLLILDEPTAALDVEGLLDVDARGRRTGKDGGLRDALPRRGRRVRGPHRLDGPGTSRRRWSTDRN